MAWIWKSAFLVIAGMILLRVSGRKSISQMSVATTVIMISIGTTIVQPIANNELWKAIGSAAIFIVSLLIIEYLQLKFDWLENLMSGRSKIIIENGQIIPKNLRSLRITVDMLEMRLRQNGISNLSDVKFATLEPNGQMGYELMRHAKPVTIGELERILDLKSGIAMEQSSLFQESKTNHHATPIDPKLQ
ncbi:membrane protein [Paenibacillus stellifer]|uniref:Membrane protein n=1 Tax=Paenibacillus stellifer TaxID=169760 RepID=A0A089LPN8_9BACL|nr:membrane protein [Paenibacillus stellifer]